MGGGSEDEGPLPPRLFAIASVGGQVGAVIGALPDTVDPADSQGGELGRQEIPEIHPVVVEPERGVDSGGGQGCSDLGPDLVVAGGDGRPEIGGESLWRCTVKSCQSRDGDGGDAIGSTAPTDMDRGHRPRCHQDHWDAVRGPHSQPDTDLRGDETVGGADARLGLVKRGFDPNHRR